MKCLSDILENVKVTEQVGEVNMDVSEIVFDSRKATAETVFVAMRGTQADGHRFISNVFESGCRAVVCEEMPAEYPADATVVLVEDTAAALGLMASSFYDEPSHQLTLVGVTGTNGKTTTATLLHRLTLLMGYKAGLFSTISNYIVDQEINATHTTPDAVTLNKIMAEMG